MAREYEAFCAGNVDRLKYEMNRLALEGWKRIRYTEASEPPYFTVTASRKYRTCAEVDCDVRLYRGECKCSEPTRRQFTEYEDLRARRTGDLCCVEAFCQYKNVEEGPYCYEHEAEAAANYALKSKEEEYND